MAAHKSRFWRICRVGFRRFRMMIWLVILFILGSLIYVNQVGLPFFIKKPLLEKLRASGIDLQFTRLRLRWYQGIVAENVRFGQADEPFSPHLTLPQVQVALNHEALAKFQIQVDSLMLRHGRLIWPLAETNHAARQLSVENIQTDLRLLPNDQWALDNFKAAFVGAAIQLSGTITNASAVREWQFLRTTKRAPAAVWQDRLRRLADTLEQIHFSAPPELKLDIRGDARDLQSFQVRMRLNAPGAVTPWGAVSRGKFIARVFPATNELSHAELSLEASDAQTQWGNTTNLQLKIHLATIEGQTNQVNAGLELNAAQVDSEWASGADLQAKLQWLHSLTNPVPITGSGALHCRQARSRWGNADLLQLSARLVTPPQYTARADESWGLWARLEPYLLDWQCHLSNADLTLQSFTHTQSSNLVVEVLDCGGTWRAPDLLITNLHACLYGGQIQGRASLGVATRELQSTFGSDVDPHKISSLLTEGGQRWLEQFSWTKPPQLKAAGSLLLPAWTNRTPDWRAEVEPGVRLTGEFSLEQGGAYRNVAVTNAQSHFSFSNMVWRLPDLTAARPEGRILAELEADQRTKDFYWRISSTLDPGIVRPLLETNQQRGFDFFTFTQPPLINAEIRGRWHDHERIGMSGRVAITNFTFRGETATEFSTGFSYSNRFLLLTGARAQRGPELMSTDGVGVDFTAQKVYLTNGFSTADPMVIARAIGPKIAATIEPYRFDQPPTAHVHGIIPTHRDEDADLFFELSGGPFHWSKFNVPRISGNVHWAGQRLVLSSVYADFYGGQAGGSARFNFAASRGADYDFAVAATNARLHLLMADLSTRTNKLEGLLSGNLAITRANSAEHQNVDGYGNVELRDGLIWDIPVFGIFSDVLNGLAPGLGNSRANSGTGSFVITNGVIRSEDLEIHSSVMRLAYRGSVDLKGQLNARADAELLRDMWLVGPLVSTVLWPVTKMFEYRVNGSLNEPRATPVYLIPKIMLMPFHPFRTIKELFPEDSGLTRTNPPSFNPP